jgi:hypothetical protein
MIPTYGNYTSFGLGFDTRTLCMNTNNFNTYQQWIPSGNFIQPISNYGLSTSTFVNNPFQLLST